MQRAARSFIWVVAATSLVGCRINISGLDRDVDFEVSESFMFQAGGAVGLRLTVEAVNGTVLVTGEPGSAVVRIGGLRRVASDTRDDAQEFLDRVSVEVSEQGDEILVRTHQPTSTDGRRVTVDYELTIPTQMDVHVVSINGEIELRSLESSVKVENVNGAVSVVDVVGDVEVDLINGSIFGDVTLLPAGRVDLLVTNGNVTLDVPSSVSAMLEADVLNGTISVVGLTVIDPAASARSLHGRLGGGDGLIDLGTTNGTITVRAR